MTDAERAELPSSLFILSGTNPFRRAAVWLVRWIVFEWIIILTIIGKSFYASHLGGTLFQALLGWEMGRAGIELH